MMNISYLMLIVVAVCFVLACWSVRQNSRESVLVNLALMAVFGIGAFIVHPYQAVAIEARRLKVAQYRANFEAERLKQLSSALGSPELAVRYIEAENRKTN